jgi:putative RNA 2'-phosphotransferase
MASKRMITISKFLSRYLRHAPEELGLTLEMGGWVSIEDLLDGCARAGFRVSGEELNEVVAGSDKQRFAFDETRQRIRANQGHSTPVDLQLQPQTPPDILYHGTAAHAVEAILRDGIKRRSRHHVHLSTTIATARTVGARHGTPVILQVDAAGMHRAGIVFYCSDNGVWLVEEVDSRFVAVVRGQ